MGRILAVVGLCLLFANSVSMAQESKPQIIGRGRVFQAAWSPDSQYLALATALGIWLYPADDLDHPSLLEMTDGATGVAFSRDGSWLMASSKGASVQLWKNEDSEWITSFELKGGGGALLGVAISPNADSVAAWDDAQHIWLWNIGVTPTPQPFLLEGHQNRIRGIAFDPTGTRLVSWEWSDVFFLWDVPNATMLHHLHHLPRSEVDIDEINAAAFSPDGSIVAVAGPGLRVFDVESGKEIVFRGTGSVDYGTLTLVFSPDGQKLATGAGEITEDNFQVCLWTVATWEEQGCFVKHVGAVKSVAFSPDGKLLASGSTDGTVQLWNATLEGRVNQSLKSVEEFPYSGDVFYAWRVEFSHDGKRLVAENGTAWVWDFGIDAPVKMLAGHSNFPYACALGPTDDVITLVSGDGMIRRWDMETNNEILISQSGIGLDESRRSFNYLTSAALNSDGTLATFANGAQDIWIIDVETDSVVDRFGSQAFYAAVLAFNQNSTMLGAGGGYMGSTVDIARLDIPDVMKSIGYFSARQQYDPVLTSLAFSPNGKQVASGNSFGEVHIWNAHGSALESENLIANLIAFLGTHKGNVGSLVYSPDGASLASGDWNLKSDSEDIRISGTVLIWDAQNPKIKSVLDPHEGGVSTMVFHPNNISIVTANGDGVIYRWDVQSGEMIKLIGKHPFGVDCLIFNQAGTQLISVGGDGLVRFWASPDY